MTLLSPRERQAYLDDVKKLGAAEARRQIRYRLRFKYDAVSWSMFWENIKAELDKLESEGK